MTLEEKETKALQLVEQGKKEEAVALLFKVIVEYAKKGNFDKADRLRQKLIDTDSMALTQIIDSGEIIEEEKTKGIDSGHKQQWQHLYDSFSQEEANAFYYRLKTASVPKGKIIIQQGKRNDKLFFIYEGRLESFCLSGTEENILKEIGPGQITGFSSFFSISLATTTVRTKSAVRLGYLTQDALFELKEQVAGLDGKIENLCRELLPADTSDIVQSQKVNRRKHHRVPAQGKAALFIIRADNTPSEKPVYGVLEDLSRGGASFVIKSSKKETARALLGRTAMVKLISGKGSHIPNLNKKGKITALQDQLFNDYAVSFKFFKPIDDDTVQGFAR